jgi:uncharacterized membrane protein
MRGNYPMWVYFVFVISALMRFLASIYTLIGQHLYKQEEEILVLWDRMQFRNVVQYVDVSLG